MSGTTETFYIPVGNIPEEDMDEFVQKVADKFRKDSDGVIRLKSEPKPKKK